MLVRIANTAIQGSSSLIWVCTGCLGLVYGEIYPNAETKPARPDPIDMDEMVRLNVRIVNREDPDQTASSEAGGSGSALFVLAWRD